MEISEISSGSFLIPAIFNQDQQHAMGSLKKLAPLQANMVVPDHGKPFHGTPGQAVELALKNL